MKKGLLFLPLLGCLALTGEPIKFVQPKAKMVIGSPYGVEIPVQIRVEPNAQNRAYRIQWEGGSSGRTLDGADDSATQPMLKIRVFHSQTIVAGVFGSDGELISKAEFQIKVCGGEEEC